LLTVKARSTGKMCCPSGSIKGSSRADPSEVLNARIAGSALSGAWRSKGDQANRREERRIGDRWDEAWLLLLTLRNLFGMMGTSGWEARRMVDSGDEEDEMEDGARVGKLDVEVSYSETEGRGEVVEVDVDVDLSERCDVEDGQCRCTLT
jgi:hypothetical protein